MANVNKSRNDRELQAILRNLNMEVRDIKDRSIRGLVLAAAYIRRETETSEPFTPLKTGNLRASWFIVSPKGLASDPLGHAGQFRDDPDSNGGEAAKMSINHVNYITYVKGLVKAQKEPVVALGYTAPYALYVHEHITGPQNWSRPGSGPKWFQAAVMRSRDAIVEIVANESHIK